MSLIKEVSHFPTPYVIVLVGPPLSGKTTEINKILEKYPDTEVISRDKIVVDLHTDDDYNTAFKSVNQKQVDKVLTSNFTRLSKSNKNVIIDMTNMTRKRRIGSLSFFGDEYYKVGIIFPVLSDEEYERRNEKRTREEKKTIPSHVIKSMISSYQTISKEEGFDKIISIR